MASGRVRDGRRRAEEPRRDELRRDELAVEERALGVRQRGRAPRGLGGAAARATAAGPPPRAVRVLEHGGEVARDLRQVAVLVLGVAVKEHRVVAARLVGGDEHVVPLARRDDDAGARLDRKHVGAVDGDDGQVVRGDVD